jgi:hypothetical protein
MVISDKAAVVSDAKQLHTLMHQQHEYYMSAPDSETFESVDEFIANWKDYDIDLNHIVRWDFSVQDSEYPEETRDYGPKGCTYANIVWVMPRKGYLFGNIIKDVKVHETPRLLAFLQKHWGYMQKQWAPVPDVIYDPVTSARGVFLDAVTRITDFQTTPVFDTDKEVTYTAQSVDELIHARVHQTAVDILSLVDTGVAGVNEGYHLIPVGDLKADDLNHVNDLAGELATCYFDMINT